MSTSKPQHNGNKNWNAEKREWISNPAYDKDARARTLILCFDGTGDTFDNDNSNVVQLTSLLKKDDPKKQMVYYQTGIGTTSSADARFSFIRDTTQALDSMFAITLGTHVLDGYEFLMNHYQEGDSICIFGFSRGAYTARALAGMIQKVGLLPTGNKQQLPFAYQIFANEHDEEFCQNFKDTFSVDVRIQFVGVWDTVASVGIIPRHLPFVSSNTAIRCFRHALALDEHRAKFIPNYYHYAEKDFDTASSDTGGLSTPVSPLSPVSPLPPATPITPATPYGDSLLAPPLSRISSTSSQKTAVEYFSPKKSTKSHKPLAETDAKEVWFSGVHTDVGGGSVNNKTRHSLARISLRWMIRECWRANTGIIFDMNKLRDVAGLDIDTEKREICEPPPPLKADSLKKFLEGRISPAEPNFLQKAWGAVTWPVATLTQVLSTGFDWLTGHTPLEVDMDPIPQTLYQDDLKDNKFMGEATEELFDALSPMNDQLHLAPSWWFLEWMPFWTKKEKALHANVTVPRPSLFSSPSKWKKYFKSLYKNHHFVVNNGRGRKVYKHIMKRGMLVHRSVRTRIDAVDRDNVAKTYTPLIQPNIPSFTLDGEVRAMTREEWVDATVGDSSRPWFHWWGFEAKEEEKTQCIMTQVRRGRKDDKHSKRV